MKRAATVLGLILGLYLIVRAIVEPLAIDMTNPATSQNDGGGPSLVGVLAVHCGPGLVAALIVAAFVRRRAHSGAGE